MKSFMIVFVGLGITASLLSGCGRGNKASGPGGFAVSVVAEPVRVERIEDRISLVGSLQSYEMVEIKNQIEGVIEEIGFQEGQGVGAGQMLFTINAAKLRASLAQAQANLGLAQTTFDRLSTLIKSNAISQQEFDVAQSNLEFRKAEVDLINAQLKEAVITAPFAGVMGERRVSLGQFVNQGTSLTFLIQQDPMRAEFRVPERYLGQIRSGQNIEMRVAAYPGETFRGEVYFVDPKVDELTRTALVKAKLPNPEGKLKSGMFTNLNLIVTARTDALTIPETALIPRSDQIFVFTIDSENKAQMKTVTVGTRLVNKVEILEGLQPGDRVIIEGHQKIGPGSTVNPREAQGAS